MRGVQQRIPRIKCERTASPSRVTSHVRQNEGGYTLETLPRTVTPYRDSVDGTRDRVTYQKLLMRSRYGLVRCAVGIWPSHQSDGTVKAGASVDLQRDTSPPTAHLPFFSLLMLLS